VALTVALCLRVIPSVFRAAHPCEIGGLGHQRRVHLPHHALPVVGVVVHCAVAGHLAAQAIRPVFEAVRGGAVGAADHPVLAVPRLPTATTRKRVPVGVVGVGAGPRARAGREHIGRVVGVVLMMALSGKKI
jgi:hypothetical protein